MTEAIIVAVITGVLSLVGTWLSNRKSATLIAYRLSELEKRVEKHNQIVERTYKLEETAQLLDERVKVANNRIEDLEKKDSV